jgi:hypothetical protein
LRCGASVVTSSSPFTFRVMDFACQAPASEESQIPARAIRTSYDILPEQRFARSSLHPTRVDEGHLSLSWGS